MKRKSTVTVKKEKTKRIKASQTQHSGRVFIDNGSRGIVLTQDSKIHIDHMCFTATILINGSLRLTTIPRKSTDYKAVHNKMDSLQNKVHQLKTEKKAIVDELDELIASTGDSEDVQKDILQQIGTGRLRIDRLDK